MSRFEEAPRGGGLETEAAGREGEPAWNGFPRRQYHEGGRRARGPRRPMLAIAPQGTKTAGVLERRGEELVLRKRVTFDKHCLRLPAPSWAFDLTVLRQAEAAGATRVEVEDEAGRVWWTSLSNLMERGQPFDRGWGQQIRLPLDHWCFLPAARGRDDQLRLFGDADHD